MRIDFGTTNLTSAGAAQQINNVTTKITYLLLQARPGNTGDLYVGLSDVSSTNGWTLQPGAQIAIDFDPDGKGTSIDPSQFYFDGDTTNDDIDWMMIFTQ